MSPLARERSRALRVRVHDAIVEEDIGDLYRDAPMLQWGSITKTVTATIAERLDADGTLSLEDAVTTHLPAAALPREVSIRSLITHRSGLRRMPSAAITGPTDPNDPFVNFTTDFFDDRVTPALASETIVPVGTYSYSNFGYAVLTRVLEKATGCAWWALARELVIEPLGLRVRDIGIDTADARLPDLHSWSGRPRGHWSMSVGPFVGSGGLISTLDVLEEYARRSVLGARSPECPIGWRHMGRYWWHNGQTRDHGAWVGVDPAAGRVITVHALGYPIFSTDATASRLRLVHL